MISASVSGGLEWSIERLSQQSLGYNFSGASRIKEAIIGGFSRMGFLWPSLIGIDFLKLEDFFGYDELRRANAFNLFVILADLLL